MRPQRWRGLGHVLVAMGESPDHATHAGYPTPFVMPDGTLRVFYSPRDAQGRSTIFSIDLAVSPDDFTLLGAPQGPWLRAGPRGAFDDAGVSVGWVGMLPDGGLECWYLGWTLGQSVPFRNSIGRAVAAPGEQRFTAAPAPVLDRSAEDPFTLGYPWLLRDGETCHMWYGTTLRWGEGWMEMEHAIRHAASLDGGRNWRRDAVLAIPVMGGEEWAVSRPTVLRDAAGWHMWFARRFDTYRLGYAYSEDGRLWRRADDAVRFTTPEAPWEAGSRTYPAVFDLLGRRWMLYNGTGYGRTGFGLAVLEED